MDVLIGVQNLSKSFTARPLFENLNFAVGEGERIGFIGPNGAGKSTLLKILAGQAKPDSGQVTVKKGLRIGYLAQVPAFAEGATIESTLQEALHDKDDWQEIARLQEISAKLDLTNFDASTPVRTLSGGWKKRLALARELVREPDLLLLDEPTNHLDLESILWLENFLAKSRFATITITHDRVFLQRVSRRILEIDRRHPGGLLSVNGDYATFLTVRAEQLSAQEERETKLRNTLRRETEWLRHGPQARQRKQQARIDAAGDLAEEVGQLESRNADRTVKLEFQSLEKNPKKLVEALGIGKSYDGRVVVPKLDLLITPKSRIGLIGPNGCGKSTLIKMLTGELAPDEGQVRFAERLQSAYFEQNRETLDPNLSLFRSICPDGEFVEYGGRFVHARGYLARFLFNYDQMDTLVSKLSGGEQSRLLLAKLMLTKANLLVLDEPTNDLDMPTLDVLGEVLNEFQGAVLLVTHDRYFLDQMTNQLLAFGFDRNGEKTITSMVGLDQWEYWRVEQEEWRVKRAKEPASASEAPGVTAKKKKLSYKDQRELDQMEATIQKAEQKVADLSAELESSQTDAKRLTELSALLAVAQAEVDRLYERWTELSS